MHEERCKHCHKIHHSPQTGNITQKDRSMSIFTCGPVVSIYAQGGANVLYGGVRILPLVLLFSLLALDYLDIGYLDNLSG